MRDQPRYRSWRFDLKAFQADDRPTLGLRVDHTGSVAMVEDGDAVRQAIRVLLSTRPGERVMRPGYGCDIHRLLFASNDDTTAGLAIHYVTQALRRWEPRIELIDVDANRIEDDPGRLDILVSYRLKATQAPDELLFSVSLEEGITQ